MNEHKFCFIICTNDAFWFDECQRYISKLNVPEGFEVELLAIEKATSMTAGYNEGMRASDAKYKIYLHQDVFIVNPDFLAEILQLFESNEKIGLIGMVGSPKLPCDFVMWSGKRVGKIYGGFFEYDIDAEEMDKDCPYVECEAVDGLLIATAYDVEWREDLLNGWDFYDISQSCEFRRKGYSVVVPKMQEAWVVHDDGIINLRRYNYYRHIIMEEYGNDIFSKNYVYSGQENELLKKTERDYQRVADKAEETEQRIQRMENKINQALSGRVDNKYEAYLKAMNDAEMVVAKAQDYGICCTGLYETTIRLEHKRGIEPYICKFSSLKEMNRNYQQLLFYFRRVRFGNLFEEDEVLELIDFIEKYQLSGYYLIMVLKNAALGDFIDRSIIARFLTDYYAVKRDSFFTAYFANWNQIVSDAE